MADYKEFFKGKKITQIGLGILGRGVGDAEFIASTGADLIVTDQKDREALIDSVKKLEHFENVKLTLGKHDIEDFKNRDLILVGPKVPLDSPFIAEAKSSGAQVTMSTALFCKLSEVPVIGVTGTRGKTTVTYLINHILKIAGKKTILGGNVQGVSTLSYLPEVEKDSVAVLELDSWQLQGFEMEKISPNVAVFTTFYPDHLDYYKDMENYLHDKTYIFSNQKEDDIVIVGAQTIPYLEKHKDILASRGKIVSKDDFPKDWNLKIPGDHNKYNAALAIAAARAFGIPEEKIKEAVESFGGVPGRLELVSEKNGIKIYNDTTSTTPEAAIAGIKALNPDQNKNIILIMGGYDKDLEMKDLVNEIKKRVKNVVLLNGTGTEKIKEDFQESKIFNSIEEAFAESVNISKPGDIILFSPAFASFGMFKNEYDRGEKFIKCVKEKLA